MIKNKCVICGKEFEFIYKRQTCSKECKSKIYSIISKNKIISDETRNKMSLFSKKRFSDPTKNVMFGKHHTEETKQKIREKALGRPCKFKGTNMQNNIFGIKWNPRKGSNHPNYKGGITIYRNNIKIVSCAKCTSTDNLDVHHKDQNRYNNDINNLIVLCRKCHKEEHNHKENKKLFDGLKVKGDE